MVHKTLVRRKIAVGEGNGKGSSCSGTVKKDYLGLRKSSQEIPSRTCNSRMPEKQPPPTLSSGRFEKMNMHIPSRTPERVKRNSLPSSSMSKLPEEESNSPVMKMIGQNEKSMKQLMLESEKVSTTRDHNIPMRSNLDGRQFKSLFKEQRIRDPIIEYEEPQRPTKFPRFSSDTKLVGDKVNGGGDYYEEDAADLGGKADKVDSHCNSEDFNMGTLHTDGGAESSLANHIHSSTEEQIAPLPVVDSLKASINGCTIMETLDGTEKSARGSPTSAELNLQSARGSPIVESAVRNCNGQAEGANIDSRVDNHENICAVCKEGGKSLLCYGKGCRRCYHHSCLGPPLDDFPSGVWHCLWCVKNKIKYGVHSVSKGIESIWDAREVEISGTQKQKQYLVKYQGLAHIHNQWLPETQLLMEVPSILADFNIKNSGVRYNSDWTKPQRLLKKRLLSFSKLHGDEQILDDGNKLECQYEWLVMWQGLDIENATWELENADFLCSSRGLSLIKDYEICQEKPNGMFSQLTANDNSLEPFKFIEYLLPVEVTNLQLEQYCYTLHSNINALCSYTKKSDPCGVLDDVLLTLRKCCDHPYISDSSMEPLGLSPAEIMDFGIKASGKLQLLDKMLSEVKTRHQKVVIIFQSIRPVVRALGDILDDVLRYRFGENSYERVETHQNTSKRQAAISRFQKNESGQFVLLLENRICNTGIKLPPVDNVIIYGSDSNPHTDLKLLQKLSFVPQSKPIRVFRLYSCCTVEELALVIEMQDPNVDKLNSLNRNVKNTLMWGASDLFSRLDEYHASDSQAPASDISDGQSLLNNVMKDFCAIISSDNEMDNMHTSTISKVLQSSGPCITDIPLFGQQKVKHTRGEEPQVFWPKLLEEINPQWRHVSKTTPRNRKRVQYFEGSQFTPEIGNGEAGKRRRKTVNVGMDAISALPSPEGGELATSKEGASTVRASNKSLPTSNVHTGDHASGTSCSSLHEVNVEPLKIVSLPDEQKSIQIFLKGEMEKVFGMLKLSDDVKQMVGRFLDFIMENHRVSWEPATILQALQISVCRMGASLLKQKVDENQLLMLTREHLKFECTEVEVANVYLKLRSLKKTFLRHLERTAGSKDKVVESERDKKIKQVECNTDKRISELKEKQKEEIEKLKREHEQKRAGIERLCRLRSAVDRYIHNKPSLAKNSLKSEDNKFTKDIEEQNRIMDLEMKEMEEKHKKEMDEEMQQAAAWLAQAKPHCTEGDVDKLHLFTSNARDDVVDKNTSDSRDGSGDVQDSSDVNNNVSDSREDVENLQIIADDNRRISDSVDDAGILPDVRDVNNDLNVNSRNDIGNLEDNSDVNNSSNTPKDMSSGDGIGKIQDDADANNSRSVVLLSGCCVEANEPSYTLNEQEKSEAPSKLPTTTTDEIQPADVLAATVSDKPMEAVSSTGALVSSFNHPNEVGNLVDSCEDNVPVAPLAAQTHTAGEISLDDHANSCSLEVSECAHSEDVTHDRPSEVNTIALNEVVRPEHPAESRIAAGGLMETNCSPTNDTNIINNDGNNNDADKSVDGETTPVALPSVQTLDNANKSADGDSTSLALPSVQSSACSVDGELLLQDRDQVPQNQCSQPLASNELQPNESQPPEFEVGSPRVDDTRPVLSNCKSIPTGNGDTEHPQSSGSDQLPPGEAECDPSDNERNDLHLSVPSPSLVEVAATAEPLANADSQGRENPQSSGSDQLPSGEAECVPSNNEGNDLHLSVPSPSLVEVATTAEPLANADSQGRENPELHVLVDAPNSTIDHSQTNLPVSRIDSQPSDELPCSSQNTQVMPHEVRIRCEHPNQAITQPSNATSIQGPNNMQMHHYPSTSSFNSSSRLPYNPLSKEYQRIGNEIDQAVKFHEDWKALQRSECEKEIAEMVAQIRNKYEAKIQEGETAFLLRKKELQGNHDKVLMNQILAEAFRSKCLDPKPTMHPQMQQAVPPSYMQYQQNASMQQPLFRSPVGFLSTAQQTPNQARIRPSLIVPSTQVPNHAAAIPNGYRPPPMSRSMPSGLSTSTLQANINPSAGQIPNLTTRMRPPSMASSSQVPNHRPLSTSRSIPTANITSSGPSTSSFQASINRSAAAPSSLPGRPPIVSEISAGNLRSLPRDVRAPAPHLQSFRPVNHMVASQPPQQKVPAQSHQPPPPPPAAAAAVNMNSPTNRVLHTGNTPISPPFLINFHNRLASLPSVPLPETGTVVNSMDLSDFRTTGNTAGTSTIPSNAGADVVCLSDDE